VRLFNAAIEVVCLAACDLISEDFAARWKAIARHATGQLAGIVRLYLRIRSLN
jgi:hypothetical protein